MKVGHVDVARLRQQIPRIDARTAVMEFVAASVRRRETRVAIPDAGEFGGQMGEMVGD
jgi:aspartate aminotransferase-like enzyme